MHESDSMWRVYPQVEWNVDFFCNGLQVLHDFVVQWNTVCLVFGGESEFFLPVHPYAFLPLGLGRVSQPADGVIHRGLEFVEGPECIDANGAKDVPDVRGNGLPASSLG